MLRHRDVKWQVHAVDKSANILITIGGLGVILAVLGMLVFIGLEVLPMAQDADVGEVTYHSLKGDRASTDTVKLDGTTQLIMCDDYREVVVRLTDDGQIQQISATSGEILGTSKLNLVEGEKVTAAAAQTRSFGEIRFNDDSQAAGYAIVAGTSKGRILSGWAFFGYGFYTYDLDQQPPEEWTRLKPPNEKLTQDPAYVLDCVGYKDEKADPRSTPYRIITAQTDQRRFRTHFGDFRLPNVVDIGGPEAPITSVRITSGNSAGEEGFEQLIAAVYADGTTRARYDSYSYNMMTDSIEAEGRSWDLNGFLGEEKIEGRVPVSVCVGEKYDHMVIACRNGDMISLRKFGMQWRPGHPEFNVFAPSPFPTNPNDIGESWLAYLTEQRSSLELTSISTPLEVRDAVFVLEDLSIAISDNHGGLQTWFPVDVERTWKTSGVSADDPLVQYPKAFDRIHILETSETPVARIGIAQKAKGILTNEEDGSIRVIDMTGEHVFFRTKSGSTGIPHAYLAPKVDGVIATTSTNEMKHWWIDAPHADASGLSLFGKVWYEGHNEPKYIWQTTAGTDDAEHKISMIPLIFGTIKGAIYALLFSIPIAILAALYTSEFMSPRIRNAVKPTMETMAALPSVVLGFLAALYIAPLAAPRMPLLIALAFFFPVVFLAFGWLWQQFPPNITGKLGPWRTFISLFVLMFFGIVLAGLNDTRLEEDIFPKVEAADPALLDPVTFKPVDKDAELALSVGDFRNWTDGGKPLDHHTFQIKTTRLTADGAVDESAKVTYSTQLASTLVGMGKDWNAQESEFQQVLRKLEAGGSHELSRDKGELREVVGLLPKGWWIPGGGGQMMLMLTLFLMPLLGFAYKVVFNGVAVFDRHIQLVKAGSKPWHPYNAFGALKKSLCGEHPGFRFIFGSMFVSVLQLGLLLGLSVLVAWGVSDLVGPLFFSYDHPTAGEVVDFRRYFFSEEGWKFGQTNSLIVGFAMGFAVIPIIFTISEDALNSVPNQLRAASMGCGASPWQTAMRVVLPAAMPGIFSAIVVGLGRAVGETMVVVMAAGGSPLMEMDPLSGFQSLSGAIAVEMPEAAKGSTHYRTLFLAGLLLFAMTFVMNTIAEIVRTRLRRKMARV